MTSQPKQNLYSIEAFEMFDYMLSEQLQNAEEQYQSLRIAIDDPYKLDDETVARVKKLYESEAELVSSYEQQVTHWKENQLTKVQEQRVAQFLDKLCKWESVIKKVLEMVPRLEETTIESLLAKDDLEVGLEALLRLMDEEQQEQEKSYDWEDGCPMLVEINQRYFVHGYIASQVGLTAAQVLERMQSASYGTYDAYREQFTFVTAFSNEDQKMMDQHPDLIPLPEELMKEILSRPVYKQKGLTLVPIETEENALRIVELSTQLMEIMIN